MLVGIAIPGAFLMSITLLSFYGYTMNMVVLFALILSVGMLVDGGIVVTEYADGRLTEGASKFQAYREASQRMAWPVISSTATTLAVFLPLLFWPGTTGEFMKFLPLMLLFTLSASLLMALIIIPTIGSIWGGRGYDASVLAGIQAAEEGRFEDLKGVTGLYLRFLDKAIRRPLHILGFSIAALVGTFILYGAVGHGVEFFPDVDVDVGMIDVRARGNLSIAEREQLVLKVEERIFNMVEIKSIYTSSFIKGPNDAAADLIGRIQIELVNWKHRRPLKDILSEIEERTADLPGIIIETQKKEAGPGGGA